jgi:predicted aminopeptidase
MIGRFWRRLLRAGCTVVAVVLVLGTAAVLLSSDVRYILRAGMAEAGILWRRRPIVAVVGDSATDFATRGKLLLVLAARSYAAESLALAVGETFTTYSTVDRDTLVLVLSASRRDRLVPYMWRYPIVGRVPYKGFFDFALAAREARRLERAGLDTYVRPSNAFSTLGWFNDPLLSTVVEEDSVELASTVIHEVTHNTLFVRGHVDFNESFASFVGYRGAEAFFRSRGQVRLAERAAARWRDEVRLSRFFAFLVDRLNVLYVSGMSGVALEAARDQVFRQAADDLAGRLAPTFETIDARRLARRPLNNAVVLAMQVYLTRLGDFDRALEESGGDLRSAVRRVVTRAAKLADPWASLSDSLAAGS